MGSITQKTERGFKLIITSCNFAKVAEVLGDSEICYWTTCITDGYFFPVQADEAGVRFNHQGKIASGQRVRDFRWEHREDRDSDRN